MSFPRKRESSPRSSRGSIKSRMTSGFSLVELILVMSIMATLIGLITINLAGIQQRASLTSIVQNLISDIRQQQIKAMIGDTEGRPTASAYGIHIDSNQYVLFNGTSYDALDPSNFKVSLPSNMQFISPGSNIIFSRVSGDISAAASIQLQDTTNSNTKTIQINKYGVITSVN